MDGDRFDALSRRLAAGVSRRTALTGMAAGLLGALGLRNVAGAQVTQATCGNVVCRRRPEKCAEGCVCCVYGNRNSRCMPPGSCSPEAVACPEGQRFCPDLGRCAECCGDGAACALDGECCSGNCFNSVCADFVTSCGGNPCRRPVNGCAGSRCCGDPAFFSCGDFCCGPPATFCSNGMCR